MLLPEEYFSKMKIFEMGLFLFGGTSWFPLSDWKWELLFLLLSFCFPESGTLAAVKWALKLQVVFTVRVSLIRALQPKEAVSLVGWHTENWVSSKLFKFYFNQPSGCVLPLPPHPKFSSLFLGRQKPICQQPSPAISEHKNYSN